MTTASFEVEVSAASALDFATLSGDWNPLHTDAAHAATTPYRRPVLHGAYSAGLVSRMAGMYLPGTDCLLHALDLRFVAPIVPPATLVVTGRVVGVRNEVGRVEVSVTDKHSSTLYVSASYQFGFHVHATAATAPAQDGPAAGPRRSAVLVTGASGGLGRAVLERLGDRAIGVSRSPGAGLTVVPDLRQVEEAIEGIALEGIVHCAWPAPDNQQLVSVPDIDAAVQYNVAEPLSDMVRLAKLLKARGVPGAALVLVGSTAALPGRHNYRMPLYSLAKCLVPELARVLAIELAGTQQRATAVVFDVIEAGMNQRLSASAKIAHANRAPSGRLPTASDAAAQIEWVLSNPGWLASGSTITLSGGALP